MSAASAGHPSDEMLELYALNQIGPDRCDILEEHLLSCHACQDRLVEVETYIAAMREACRTAKAPAREPAMHGWWWPFSSKPAALALAGAAFALVIMATLAPGWRRISASPETEIRLSSSRGTLDNAEPAASKVRLLIDTADLPSYPNYRIAVVNDSGKAMWQTQMPSAPQISVRLPFQLSPGSYWVRVEQPNGELLREFSLNLK